MQLPSDGSSLFKFYYDIFRNLFSVLINAKVTQDRKNEILEARIIIESQMYMYIQWMIFSSVVPIQNTTVGQI